MSDDTTIAHETNPHDEDDHAHEHGTLAELVTLRDWLRYAVTRFNQAGIFCGHGLVDSFDEAAYLLTHRLGLPLSRLEIFLDACITADEQERLLELIEARADDRVPAAYLSGEAWLGDFAFAVDERVLIPRSYFAAMLETGMAPWVDDPADIGSALDMCTGCGCLAILMAYALPEAEVSAVDLSADALELAHENVARYGLDEQIDLIQSDLFAGLAGRRFDLIISNPPYVTTASMETLPAEYLHEPRIALAAGDDGLDIVRRLLAEAQNYLNSGGILAVEVGHNRDLVESSFPDLPFSWACNEDGDDKVFVLTREQLAAGA